jgi:hypothetical protein
VRGKGWKVGSREEREVLYVTSTNSICFVPGSLGGMKIKRHLSAFSAKTKCPDLYF